MGQHLSRRRGRRRIEPLLLLLQAARLDAHPREAARAAEVPRGDGRRARPPPPPPTRRLRSSRPSGTTSATCGRCDSTTGPSTSATCSSARSASSTSRGTPTGRGSTSSRARRSTPRAGSTSTTSPTRSSRSSGRGRPRPRSCRRSNRSSQRLYVFQREPGWVMPKGERDLTDEERATFSRPLRRKRDRWRPEVASWRRACAAASSIDPSTKVNQRARGAVPPVHRPPVRRPARSTRGGHADVPVPGEAAGHRQHVLSRAQAGERRARPAGGGVGDTDGHRRRRRRRAPPSTSSSWRPGSSPRTTSPGSSVVGRDGKSLQEHWDGGAARVPRHHGAGVPQLLHALRAGHQRRRDRDDAREPGRVRGSRGEADATRARDRDRGEASASRRGGTAGSSRRCRARRGR